MKNYFFKASLNIISFIIKITILHNILNIRNIDTSHKFIIKIKNMVFI